MEKCTQFFLLRIRLRMSRVENPSMFMPFAKYRIQFVIVIAYLDSDRREQHRKGIGTEPSFKKFRQCQQAIALQQRSPLYCVPLTTSKMIKGKLLIASRCLL